jgi:hypothetical protein
MSKSALVSLLKDRKVQWTIAAIILIVVISWSSYIRVSNWDLLTDQTTGEKVLIELDSLYFMRVSQTLMAQGSLPALDMMRYPAVPGPFTQELLPHANIILYKIMAPLSNFSFRDVVAFSPVVYFIIGMILFFFMCYALTKSKVVSVIASVFLAFVPSYLYRTMAGFADHDSFGMAAFFAACTVAAFAMNYFDKKKITLSKAMGFSVALGFFTAFTILAYAGVATIIFVIIPLAFLLLWISKITFEEDYSQGIKLLSFYFGWIVTGMLFSLLMGADVGAVAGRFLLSTSGIIGVFVLVFCALDVVLLKFLKGEKSKHRMLYTLIGAVLIGFVGLFAVGRNPFDLIVNLWQTLLHPFGEGRVGLTVAENNQPYLVDWIDQTGKVLFWMFVLGGCVIGYELCKSLKSLKKRAAFVFFWALMISGVLFSRISSGSLLNGTNFLSQAFYLVGVTFFIGYFIKTYFKDKWEISGSTIFLTALFVAIIISGRAAVRVFFLITPFICLIAAYLIWKLWGYSKTSKDEMIRPILIGALIISVIASAITLSGFVQSMSSQAQYTGPSSNDQWQRAMEWVRDNTSPGSIFIHWWDYGYAVQSLGERPTVTDGGHLWGYWDHLIGRYLLTTPHPETAYSLMKTHNVSYLLIDPTDLGKYPAYSSIGSNENGSDRYAGIPTMQMDDSQTTETSKGVQRIYIGGSYLDADVIYKDAQRKEIVLPEGIGAVLAVGVEAVSDEDGSTTFTQPSGIFYYNNQRYKIPLRYIYINGELLDFKTGLEAVVMIIPSVSNNRVNPLGTVIYISPKVSEGLFAQIYLMDNAFGNYDNLELAESTEDIVVQSMKSQGIAVGDFVYYNGFRGPLKIWKVNYPENTLARDEFLRTSGGWGEFDNLEFTK